MGSRPLLGALRGARPYAWRVPRATRGDPGLHATAHEDGTVTLPTVTQHRAETSLGSTSPEPGMVRAVTRPWTPVTRESVLCSQTALPGAQRLEAMAEHLRGSATPNSPPGPQPCVRARNSRQGPRLRGSPPACRLSLQLSVLHGPPRGRGDPGPQPRRAGGGSVLTGPAVSMGPASSEQVQKLRPVRGLGRRFSRFYRRGNRWPPSAAGSRAGAGKGCGDPAVRGSPALPPGGPKPSAGAPRPEDPFPGE